MSNELLWVVLLLVNFSLIIAVYKFFGKTGLYVWTAIAAIIANIQVIKTVELFGFVTTLGNILYATSFLATDILSEIYGRKSARKSVLIGMTTLIVVIVLMQLSLLFVPHESDFAHPALETIFSILPRIAIASITAYCMSQLHDVWAYEFWKKKFPKFKHIWIRNNASTMISQLIDTAIFCFIAFWGTLPTEVFWDIALTTYVLKWLVAASDTLFVYIARLLHEKGLVTEID